MAKRVQSWFKPDGIPNLIAKKKVDYSIFSPGSLYISRSFKQYFLDANQGIELRDGEVKRLTLVINDKDYDADLRCNYSPNTKGERKENLQIRYDRNTELKNLLLREFVYSDKYINGQSYVKIPDDIAEYIEFYKTETPFKYVVKLVKSKAQIMGYPFRNIFSNVDEVRWTFTFIQRMLIGIGIIKADSEKFSITLPDKQNAIHVNYQAWRMFGIKKRENSGLTVEFACKDIYSKRVNMQRIFDFKQPDDEESIGIYGLTFNQFRDKENSLKVPFNDTWRSIKNRFSNQQKTQYLNNNVKDLAQAIFDNEILEYIIIHGLDNLDSSNSEDKKTSKKESQTPKDNKPEEETVFLNLSYSVQEFAQASGIDEVIIERWIRAIIRKRQAILFGPPGTGKTYAAQKLAQLIVSGGDGIIETIQFHPAYSYEDFIMGIRPSTENGVVSYKQTQGRFVEFCNRSKDKKGNCVLIIDEINRANLSRVFGELMYLIEYRNHPIPLSNGESFFVPQNVYIIGTMNTADRSISFVDHALRRRFAFLELDVNYGVLERFHKDGSFPVKKLIDWLKRINQVIDNKRYSVGISFFLRENLRDDIQDIWEMEIIPYLEEYFFDQPEKVTEFVWEQLEDSLS